MDLKIDMPTVEQSAIREAYSDAVKNTASMYFQGCFNDPNGALLRMTAGLVTLRHAYEAIANKVNA